jgi:hypothetical protein
VVPVNEYLASKPVSRVIASFLIRAAAVDVKRNVVATRREKAKRFENRIQIFLIDLDTAQEAESGNGSSKILRL